MYTVNIEFQADAPTRRELEQKVENFLTSMDVDGSSYYSISGNDLPDAKYSVINLIRSGRQIDRWIRAELGWLSLDRGTSQGMSDNSMSRQEFEVLHDPSK